MEAFAGISCAEVLAKSHPRPVKPDWKSSAKTTGSFGDLHEWGFPRDGEGPSCHPCSGLTGNSRSDLMKFFGFKICGSQTHFSGGKKNKLKKWGTERLFGLCYTSWVHLLHQPELSIATWFWFQPACTIFALLLSKFKCSPWLFLLIWNQEFSEKQTGPCWTPSASGLPGWSQMRLRARWQWLWVRVLQDTQPSLHFLGMLSAKR